MLALPLCGSSGTCQAQEINVCQAINPQSLRSHASLGTGFPVPPDASSSLDLSRSRLHICTGRFSFVELYELRQVLGSGLMGEVYSATERAAPQLSSKQQLRGFGARSDETAARSVAVKVFTLAAPQPIAPPPEWGASPPSSPRTSGPTPEARRGSFETEVGMLSRLDHPNIVRMYESFREASRLLIVLEHCAGGELYEYVARAWRSKAGAEDASTGLPERQSQAIFRQMLRGVSYLHGRMMVHRDVKTENFLILEAPGEAPDGSAGSELLLKLCDFGSTAQLSDTCPRSLEKVGTPSYTAPEVYRKLGASFPADVWSLGVVLYMLITGTNPFRRTGRETNQQLMQRIVEADIDRKSHIWRELTKLSRELVRSLIVIDEDQRLTCPAALRHAWVSSDSNTTGMSFFTRSRPSTLPEGVCGFAPGLLSLISEFWRLDPLQRLLVTVCTRLTPEANLFRADATGLPWYELFCSFDADLDGVLSLVELADGLDRLMEEHSPELTASCSRAHLEEMLLALDVDRSGAVEWCEWTSLVLLGTGASVVSVAPVRAALRALDAPTCDGRISAGDLALLFGEGPVCERSQAAATELLQQWGFQPDGSEPSLDEEAAVKALLRCYDITI